MRYAVLRVTDPVEALAISAPYLQAQPVEHNFLLTLLNSRIKRREDEKFWIVQLNGETCGFAAGSLDRPLHVAARSPDAIRALANSLSKEGQSLSGVVGVATSSALFTGAWTEQRGLGASPAEGGRVYEQEVQVPLAPVGGELSAATYEDTGLTLQLTRQFFDQIGEMSADLQSLVERRIAEKTVYLWRHGTEVCSLTGHFAPAAGVARIHTIFTPTEYRGRGYGAAALWSLSTMLAANGLRRVAFTQLRNATSNDILRRIGFRAVYETLRYDFLPRIGRRGEEPLGRQ
jgi:predicted GNAT family acetyltransferase